MAISRWRSVARASSSAGDVEAGDQQDDADQPTWRSRHRGRGSAPPGCPSRMGKKAELPLAGLLAGGHGGSCDRSRRGRRPRGPRWRRPPVGRRRRASGLRLSGAGAAEAEGRRHVSSGSHTSGANRPCAPGSLRGARRATVTVRLAMVMVRPAIDSPFSRVRQNSWLTRAARSAREASEASITPADRRPGVERAEVVARDEQRPDLFDAAVRW